MKVLIEIGFLFCSVLHLKIKDIKTKFMLKERLDREMNKTFHSQFIFSHLYFKISHMEKATQFMD